MIGDEVRQYLDFVKALNKNPYDIATRGVFADWLEERGLDDEASEQRSWTKKKHDAELWLKDFAVNLGMKFGELVKEGDEIATGEYCFNNDDAPYIMRNNWAEFLEHWQNYTGKKVNATEEDATYFHCAC